MAQVIWTEPALQDLDKIADYIALDKPDAARRLVRTIVQKVEHLEKFPKMGKIPKELRHMPYRQLVIPPCRIFYRWDEMNAVYIIYVMRQEQAFRKSVLRKRDFLRQEQ